MKKVLLFILFLPLSVNAQWKDKIREVDSVLTRLYEQHLFNGTVLIGEKGKVLYKKAFGIAGADQRALTTSSAFNLASVSKQFFAMMVMMLKEEGKLRYDDPVEKYLPLFPYKSITVRQLMNHTSGMPEYFDIAAGNRNLLDTLTNESMLALLASERPALVFKPGEKFQYCNTNYTTLASVIEQVAHVSCHQFFADRIAKPLRLKNTYIYNLRMKHYPESRVFGFHYEKGKPVSDDLLWLDGIIGDGNIYSSVEDLYKWDQALYTGKLVSKATFAEALMPAKLNDGSLTNYGFGWFIETKDKEVAHSGGWVAFGTYIDRFINTNQTYILLDNSANPYARRIVKEILLGKPYRLPHVQLITNIQLVDGTGSSVKPAAVRIIDDRIRDIGPLQQLKGETIINGDGLALSPGFIDSHSHHNEGIKEDRNAIAATSQGITTIIIGQDGGSEPFDSLKRRMSSRPASINIGSYTGHASLRSVAMKETLLRAADSTEIEQMKKLLAAEIKQGSFGLSTGLEYEEAFYSTREEVLELAKATAAVGGRYISHIRSEDVYLEDAIDEIISIGREAKVPVQISHLKIAMRSKWGRSTDILGKLQEARADGVNITADCYPYTMWSSTPRVLFPKKDFSNLTSARYATLELFDPALSVITYFPSNRSYEGKSVTEISAILKKTEPEGLMQIIKESGDGGAAIAATSMLDDDVINFLKWNQTNVCSDGSYGGHPRGRGAFTRVLGNYVREKKIMSLETAVNKMTGLTAEHLGIRDRGLITPGFYADLVLFDPATVSDHATITNPKALSSGIKAVWVNGSIVYQDQKATGVYAGRLVTR